MSDSPSPELKEANRIAHEARNAAWQADLALERAKRRETVGKHVKDMTPEELRFEERRRGLR